MYYNFIVKNLSGEAVNKWSTQMRSKTYNQLKGKVEVKVSTVCFDAVAIWLKVGDLPISLNFRPKGCKDIKYLNVIKGKYLTRYNIQKGDEIFKISNASNWEKLKQHIIAGIEELGVEPTSFITVLMSDKVRKKFGVFSSRDMMSVYEKQDEKEKKPINFQLPEKLKQQHEQYLEDCKRFEEIKARAEKRKEELSNNPTVTAPTEKASQEVYLNAEMTMENNSLRFKLSNGNTLISISHNSDDVKNTGKWKWYEIHGDTKHTSSDLTYAIDHSKELIRKFFSPFGIKVNFH